MNNKTLRIEISFRDNEGRPVTKAIPIETLEMAVEHLSLMKQEEPPRQTNTVYVDVYLENDFSVSSYQLGYHDQTKGQVGIPLGSKRVTPQQVEELRNKQGEQKWKK